MMKTAARPIKSTILWGFIGGFFYIPLCTAFDLVVPWPLSWRLTIWALLTIYGVLLARCSCTALRSIFLPFLLLLIAAIFIRSTSFFLFSAFAALGWIRSGICFRRSPFVKRCAAEIGLGAATALLAADAVPGVTLPWALAVLMFFLIQALYFVFFEPGPDSKTKIEMDPFEIAKMAAENILDSAEKEIII